jgi:hypothetical protein
MKAQPASGVHALLADGAGVQTLLDLNPVIARPDGAHVVDARIRLLPAQPADPCLRRLS